MCCGLIRVIVYFVYEVLWFSSFLSCFGLVRACRIIGSSLPTNHRNAAWRAHGLSEQVS